MTTEFLSCNSNPIIKLEENGVAPELKYSLPQRSCIDSNGVYPFAIDETKFEDDCFVVIGEVKDHFWVDNWSLVGDDVIKTNIANFYTANVTNNAVNKSGATNDYDSNKPRTSLSDAIKASSSISQAVDPAFDINGITASHVATKVKEGLRPVEAVNAFGDFELHFMKEPSSVKPKLYIIEHYKTCNFLGDYGAGKTIKTTSLLPGEKVTISIKTFKQLISDTKKYQNVLDSYSRETLHEIEKSIEGELNVSLGLDISGILSRTLGISLPASADLPLDISAGINEGVTMNSSRGVNINVLGSVIDKQVTKSSNLREIEVNTETNVTETTEESTELIREFENINHSRVLNFVFRQLLQEYISITYLNDVSFMYSNGYPEFTKIVKLDGLKNLIYEVIKSTDRADVLSGILCELCSVYDYTGTIQKFIERKTCPIQDIDGNPVRTDTYYRKDPTLLQSYPAGGNPIITVNGIIMDIRQRILRTDSVIVDALLGQGEALDCYNMKLQDAATVKAKLDNDALTQQMAIIDAQTTEADKADKYKKVFGTCCENPQTQIIT